MLLPAHRFGWIAVDDVYSCRVTYATLQDHLDLDGRQRIRITVVAHLDRDALREVLSFSIAVCRIVEVAEPNCPPEKDACRHI